jgi:ABC-2 type transport system permease protein
MIDQLLLKSLRDRRRGLIGWITGIVGLVIVQMAVYPTVRDSASDWGQATESFPEVMKDMFRITDYTSETGYLTTELLSFMVPFIFMGLGASWGSRLVAEDEEAHTADILFGLPLSRRSILLTRMAAGYVAVFSAALAFVMSLVIGGRILDMSIPNGHFANAGLMVFEVGLVAFGVAMAISTITGHRGMGIGVSMGFTIALFIVYSLAPLVDFFDAVSAWNPMQWTLGSDPLVEGMHFDTLVYVMLWLALCMAASMRRLDRRDIAG